MIVIRARGAKDVRELERLARRLGTDEVASATPRPRTSVPTVSLLPQARIAPATREAMMKLEQVEAGQGEYELD